MPIGRHANPLFKPLESREDKATSREGTVARENSSVSTRENSPSRYNSTPTDRSKSPSRYGVKIPGEIFSNVVPPGYHLVPNNPAVNHLGKLGYSEGPYNAYISVPFHDSAYSVENGRFYYGTASGSLIEPPIGHHYRTASELGSSHYRVATTSGNRLGPPQLYPEPLYYNSSSHYPELRYANVDYPEMRGSHYSSEMRRASSPYGQEIRHSSFIPPHSSSRLKDRYQSSREGRRSVDLPYRGGNAIGSLPYDPMRIYMDPRNLNERNFYVNERMREEQPQIYHPQRPVDSSYYPAHSTNSFPPSGNASWAERDSRTGGRSRSRSPRDRIHRRSSGHASRSRSPSFHRKEHVQPVPRKGSAPHLLSNGGGSGTTTNKKAPLKKGLPYKPLLKVRNNKKYKQPVPSLAAAPSFTKPLANAGSNNTTATSVESFLNHLTMDSAIKYKLSPSSLGMTHHGYNIINEEDEEKSEQIQEVDGDVSFESQFEDFEKENEAIVIEEVKDQSCIKEEGPVIDLEEGELDTDGNKLSEQVEKLQQPQLGHFREEVVQFFIDKPGNRDSPKYLQGSILFPQSAFIQNCSDSFPAGSTDSLILTSIAPGDSSAIANKALSINENFIADAEMTN